MSVQGVYGGPACLPQPQYRTIMCTPNANDPRASMDDCAATYGICGYTCEAGWRNCDSFAGCEVNSTTDVNNCGACGLICPAGDICCDSLCTAPGSPGCPRA